MENRVSMRRKIYYFSGTGNSFAIAKELGRNLADTQLESIAKLNFNKETDVNCDSIGFVFPVYLLSMPKIVVEFIRKMHFQNKPYIFCIATYNGKPGFPILQLDKILKNKKQKLSTGFSIIMPGNSLIIGDLTNSLEIQNEKLERAKEKVKSIALQINMKYNGGMDRSGSLINRIKGFIYHIIIFHIYNTPSKFNAISGCNQCLFCIRVCPRNNIKLVQNTIKWGPDCEQCLACFHWCPKAAIQIEKYTIGKRRYHHPDIKLNEMPLR